MLTHAVLQGDAVPAFCQGPQWKPRDAHTVSGTCGACGAPLEGRRLWFCRSPKGEDRTEKSCRGRYAQNHFWQEASREAVRRQPACVEMGDDCSGRLEVHHVIPVRRNAHGVGYANGCWHHQQNLRVLCASHHRRADVLLRRADGLVKLLPPPRKASPHAGHQAALL